jgi:hypothetical protein
MNSTLLALEAAKLLGVISHNMRRKHYKAGNFKKVTKIL